LTSLLVEKDSHLFELSRYVVLNSVQAGLVKGPRDWPWSSCRATAVEVQGLGPGLFNGKIEFFFGLARMGITS
jgi:hypothetical protein